MPKAPRTRAGENARRQVWDAAIRLFAAKGFHGVGIRELAEGAGMSSATLYHYMGTKEELLASVMRASLDRLNGAAERVVADAPDPQSQITRLVHVHVLTHALRPEETAVVDNELEALGPERRTAMVALRDAYEGHWRRAIANGCASGLFTVPDQTFARMALLEMCSGVAKWYSPDGPIALDGVATAHARLALQLLGVPVHAIPLPAPTEIHAAHALVEEIWQVSLGASAPASA
ncbi:TetR/AcrR family transcriptional regulator [Streptomyces sp. NPDC093097]|uniref:TetR/AcrR family transcriptional regulator n=1 Tax=Streptomyces sp. NPDC093097 TaxID=3366027 RepID=UPI00380869AC